MGQPTPPGDVPLIEGLDSSWNEFVSAIPEDKRSEIGPKLKERVSAFEPLKGYEDFHKSGVTPDKVGQALNLYSIIENNPKQVYDLIGESLGITAAQAKDVVEELEDADEDDPRFAEIASLKQQVETLVAIQLAQRDQQTAAQQAAEADKAVENELTSLKKKYGSENVDEEQIIMRMIQKNQSAEDAYKEHQAYVEQIRARRPAPTIMGGGGSVPNRAIDPTKLDNKATKNLVAQMLESAKTQ